MAHSSLPLHGIAKPIPVNCHHDNPPPPSSPTAGAPRRRAIVGRAHCPTPADGPDRSWICRQIPDPLVGRPAGLGRQGLSYRIITECNHPLRLAQSSDLASTKLIFVETETLRLVSIHPLLALFQFTPCTSRFEPGSSDFTSIFDTVFRIEAAGYLPTLLAVDVQRSLVLHGMR